MGPSRRMKKQGPPPSLEEFNKLLKRKATRLEKHNGPAKKRRWSDEEEAPIAKAVGKSGGLEKQMLVNMDSQTVPVVKGLSSAARKALDSEAESEQSSELDEVNTDLVDGEEDGDNTSDMEEDGLGELDVNGVSSENESFFDLEEENVPKAIYSDDEDDPDAEQKLTAANIEGLSHKLDLEQAKIAAEAQAELEDDTLQTNIVGDDVGVLASGDATTPGLAPDLQLLRNRITDTIRILGDVPKLGELGKSRSHYMALLHSDICTYYGYTHYLAQKLLSLFPPLEAFAFFEANESPRPVVLRTNTLRTNRRTLASALINRGVILEPVGKWSKVGLQVFESPVPLGATPEYLGGHYILQAASSFLPVMALAPQPGERILDMAAAPGGKTTYISALMRNTGVVFANDANRQRAKGLIGNIHRLGCKNTIVSNLDAKTSFPKVIGGFDRVLLDAPCSGTGVIGKDPSVKTSKTEKDFMVLPHMQKQLLIAAIDSTDHSSKTGGYIVYSTCSVTVEENEGVVQYALRKRPNVKIVDTGLGSFGSEGFRNFEGKNFDEKMGLARRYFPHRENVDGFFVCKLKKIGPMPKEAVNGACKGEGERTKSGAEDVNDDIKDADVEMERVPGVEEDDDFGGFNSAEDEKYLANAQKKWLKRRGLDPRLASKDAKQKSRKDRDKR